MGDSQMMLPFDEPRTDGLLEPIASWSTSGRDANG